MHHEVKIFRHYNVPCISISNEWKQSNKGTGRRKMRITFFNYPSLATGSLHVLPQLGSQRLLPCTSWRLPGILIFKIKNNEKSTIRFHFFYSDWFRTNQME